MRKKVSFFIYSFMIMGMFLILASACEKDKKNDEVTPIITKPKPVPTTVTDIDGNVYHTVTIGTQVWMVENLRTTKYRNGNSIPNIIDETQWSNLTTAAYCNYDNNISNATTYGRLYNWYAVNDLRNICPVGWHVPTFAEWATLTNYLGGDTITGGKLKEVGITYWNTPNAGATNETGFTALPSGTRFNLGIYSLIGYNCSYWSSTEDSTIHQVLSLEMNYNNKNVSSYYYNKNFGFSVRCIMD